MLDNMIMHRELDDRDHPYSLGWGTHKTDWHFFRDQIKAQKDLRLPLYKYMHCPFPLLQLASDPNEPQAALYEAGTLSLRISMDIPEDESFWELNTLVKQFKDLIPDKFRSDTCTLLNPCQRKSYGNCSKDRINAWDITLTGT